ncbi:hypothetical protein TI05_09240 [Achromatium sp. WMS3]|nr:hypothetical protein TI05_09240 [Achromatium sp. WMS3]
MNPENLEDDLRPEYDFDFTKAIRGKYYQEYTQNSNIIVLDPDIAAVFHNSKAVNTALRSMLAFAKQTKNLINEPTSAS